MLMYVWSTVLFPTSKSSENFYVMGPCINMFHIPLKEKLINYKNFYNRQVAALPSVDEYSQLCTIAEEI